VVSAVLVLVLNLLLLVSLQINMVEKISCLYLTQTEAIIEEYSNTILEDSIPLANSTYSCSDDNVIENAGYDKALIEEYSNTIIEDPTPLAYSTYNGSDNSDDNVIENAGYDKRNEFSDLRIITKLKRVIVPPNF